MTGCLPSAMLAPGTSGGGPELPVPVYTGLGNRQKRSSGGLAQTKTEASWLLWVVGITVVVGLMRIW
jgi:hypothetical protein